MFSNCEKQGLFHIFIPELQSDGSSKIRLPSSSFNSWVISISDPEYNKHCFTLKMWNSFKIPNFYELCSREITPHKINEISLDSIQNIQAHRT